MSSPARFSGLIRLGFRVQSGSDFGLEGRSFEKGRSTGEGGPPVKARPLKRTGPPPSRLWGFPALNFQKFQADATDRAFVEFLLEKQLATNFLY